MANNSVDHFLSIDNFKETGLCSLTLSQYKHLGISVFVGKALKYPDTEDLSIGNNMIMNITPDEPSDNVLFEDMFVGGYNIPIHCLR